MSTSNPPQSSPQNENPRERRLSQTLEVRRDRTGPAPFLQNLTVGEFYRFMVRHLNLPQESRHYAFFQEDHIFTQAVRRYGPLPVARYAVVRLQYLWETHDPTLERELNFHEYLEIPLDEPGALYTLSEAGRFDVDPFDPVLELDITRRLLRLLEVRPRHPEQSDSFYNGDDEESLPEDQEDQWEELPRPSSPSSIPLPLYDRVRLPPYYEGHPPRYQNLSRRFPRCCDHCWERLDSSNPSLTSRLVRDILTILLLVLAVVIIGDAVHIISGVSPSLWIQIHAFCFVHQYVPRNQSWMKLVKTLLALVVAQLFLALCL